ncbi:putative permease of the drug/metabolite transporter, partial [Vibrio parahaemolyticus EKP-021]
MVSSHAQAIFTSSRRQPTFRASYCFAVRYRRTPRVSFTAYTFNQWHHSWWYRFGFFISIQKNKQTTGKPIKNNNFPSQIPIHHLC